MRGFRLAKNESILIVVYMAEPLLPPLSERGSGILLHPTSLPGNQGVGVLGSEAFRWLDFLQEAGVRTWQVLPLGPTGYGDSPYASLSSHAGNPHMIDLLPLQEFGLLDGGDMEGLSGLDPYRVDFHAVAHRKWPILRLAWKQFRTRERAYLPNYGIFEEFLRAHDAVWLDAYASFVALKIHFQGKPWYQWEEAFRSWERAREEDLLGELAEEILAQKFYQYLFFGQWELVRGYARESGVRILGDIPIFPALDSADVWASPECFLLDANGQPEFVAGVPPDYFSPHGQLWGNPLFDWEAFASTGYAWWMDRFASAFRVADDVRLDHFRGFYNYWCIPANATDARWGEWREGPGLAFFEAVRDEFPEAGLIAEDLGDLSDEVREFRKDTGLPGMAILQFAFDGEPDNLYLPHNLDSNTVLYTGTHDNNTTRGWYETASRESRDQVRRYFRVSGEEIAWDLIRAGMASVAKLAIFPLQDLLSLDENARFNIPGVVGEGNWRWRCPLDALTSLEGPTADYWREMSWLYGR